MGSLKTTKSKEKELITNGVKIFGKKSPYYITKIQNVEKSDTFRYNGEWCKLNQLNPYWFYTKNEFGTTLTRIFEHFDRLVAVPLNKKKIKK